MYIYGDVPNRGLYPFDPRLNPYSYLLLAGLSLTDLEDTPVQVLSLDGTMQPLTPEVVLTGGEVLRVGATELLPAAVGGQVAIEEDLPAEQVLRLIKPVGPDEIRVHVTGAVTNPRRFQYDLSWTLSRYINAAGGPSADADLSQVLILRSSGRIVSASEVTHLRPGDTVFVPKMPERLFDVDIPATYDTSFVTTLDEMIPDRVSVIGAVRYPSTFARQPDLTPADYIRLAGGLTEMADAAAAYLLHRDGSRGNVDADLRSGDVVVVPTSVEDGTMPGSATQLGAPTRQFPDLLLYRDIHQTLRRFGLEYFAPARERIRRLERAIEDTPLPTDEGTAATGTLPSIEGSGRGPQTPRRSALIQDAITGFVGPIDQLDGNVLMSIPHQRIIAPGDSLHVTWWSPSSTEPPETLTLLVDPEGAVLLPPHGRLVVRGKTLEEFDTDVRDLLAQQTFSDLKVVATFDGLRTIQVVITGHVFRPGTYAISAAGTLFNALYMCGGPGEGGSLRNISLVRAGKTIHVDFYKYLLEGDAGQEQTLQGGDMIYFGPAGAQISLRGEVQRPGIYELTEGEGLAEALAMSGGVRSGGFAKSVQIDSVQDHSDRVIHTIDATTDLSSAPPLFDGDVVTVFPVISAAVNTVAVIGRVKQPRIFGLTEDMRIRDLILLAGGTREDAYLDRADLFRLNPDGATRTLIPISLREAMTTGGAANLPLQESDRLVVYAHGDVEWRASRDVSAHGAVVNAGTYERADDARLEDLLRMAGGVRPEGHERRALLFRVDDRNRLAISRQVDLTDETTLREPLRDGDVLLVLTHEEVEWEPVRVVSVTGAVQEPGLVPYMDNMRVSDALFGAGGLMPDHANMALLLRKDERWDRVRVSRYIDLAQATPGNEDGDVVLQPEDELIVYDIPELKWEPSADVYVLGAVQSPGILRRTDGMRVSDAILRAGGVMPNAYLERADVVRYLEDYEGRITIPVDVERALGDDETQNLVLHDGDTIRISTLRSATYVPEWIVTIYGAVQRPDTYRWTEGMRLHDLLFVAGGLLPGHRMEAEIARARGQDHTTVLRADLRSGAQRDDEAGNLAVEPGDVVSIMRSRTFYDVPRTVGISGETAYPGTYVLEGDERISDLIDRAGGLLPSAYVAGATLSRNPTFILDEDGQRTLLDLWKEIEAQKTIEFARVLAKARVDAQRIGVTLEPLADIVWTAAQPIIGTLGAGGNASALPALASPGDADDASAQGAVMVAAPAELAAADADEAGVPADLTIAVDQSQDTGPARAINLVTPARDIPNLIPGESVVIDLVDILKNPHGEKDLTLDPGDHLKIPPRRSTVSATGAVVRANTFVYQSGLDLEGYLELAGGLAVDADEKNITVMKMDGRTIRADKLKRIDPGDIIFVPPRVMSEKISSGLDSTLTFLRFILATAATTVVLVAAISR